MERVLLSLQGQTQCTYTAKNTNDGIPFWFWDSLGNQISFYCEQFHIQVALDKLVWTNFLFLFFYFLPKSCPSVNAYHSQVFRFGLGGTYQTICILCKEWDQWVNIQAPSVPPFPPLLLSSSALSSCWRVKQTLKGSEYWSITIWQLSLLLSSLCTAGASC